MQTYLGSWLDAIRLDPAPIQEESPVGGPRVAHAVRIVHDGLMKANGTRCVPSAGAVHPYDVLVLSEDVLFRVDLTRRECFRLPVVPTALTRQLGTDADHVILLTRPWLSMRKYGPRGYLYTQLDAGHAATNLLGVAMGRGTAELRLRAPRAAVRGLLEDLLPFREVHSVLSIAPGRSQDVLPVRGHRAESRGELESYCWSLVPPSDDDDVAGPVTTDEIVRTYLPDDLCIRPDEWLNLARDRLSCKEFSTRPAPRSALIDVLGALRTALPTDQPAPDGGLRLTVALAPGAAADALRRAFPGGDVRVAGELGDPDLVTRLCMGQRHLGPSQALVLFHTRPSNLRDSLFRAAAAAQLIYLGAARSGLAVTAVGGFAGAELGRLAGIGYEEEVVYVVALGTDAGGGQKLDRLQVAHAHAES